MMWVWIAATVIYVVCFVVLAACLVIAGRSDARAARMRRRSTLDDLELSQAEFEARTDILLADVEAA